MGVIKVVGDYDPVLASSILDSLPNDLTVKSEHTRMSYKMLKLRLQDKADSLPNSDVIGNEIYDYFMKKGNDLEKMEACYYLASVCRDLHDSPRAILYFQQLLDIAESSEEMDSVMLTNTFSQLSSLYRIQYDYHSAMMMAEKGLSAAKILGIVDPIYIMDVATIAYALGDTVKTIKMQQEALDMICREKAANKYADVICEILSIMSEYHIHEECIRCIMLLDNITLGNKPHNYYSSLADYYLSVEKIDSAIYYYKMQYESNNITLAGRFNATQGLASLYNKTGNIELSQKYALIFMDVEEEYRKALQHEQSTQVHNEYIYKRNRAKEEKAYKAAADAKKKKSYWILAFVMLFVLSGTLIQIQKRRSLKRKNNDLKIINEKNCEIQKNERVIIEKEAYITHQKQKIEQTQGMLIEIAKELHEKEQEVATKGVELQKHRMELQEKNRELKVVESQLRENEIILAEKLKQNEKLFKFAFTERLDQAAKTILEKFQKASNGIEGINDGDWKQLYSAIDNLYPKYSRAIMHKIQTLTEEKMRISYLLKAGFSQPQIVRLTGYPGTTVWRKSKEIAMLLGEDLMSLEENNM